MAITYTQLNKLPSRSTLRANDKLLVAADAATELGYVTYQTAFQHLSAQIVADSHAVELQSKLITNIDGLSQSDASTKGVAGNVVNDIVGVVNGISESYLNVNKTDGLQTIKGQLSCKITPEFTTPTVSSGDNKAVTISLLKSYVSSRINNIPIFTTMFCKTDLNNRSFILNNVLPLVSKSTTSDQKFTLIVKFKSTDNSTTARKMAFAFNNNGTSITPTITSGQLELKYTKATTGKNAKPAVDHTWCHAKVQFTLARNVSPNKVKWQIDNINAAVDVSMAIYQGYV